MTDKEKKEKEAKQKLGIKDSLHIKAAKAGMHVAKGPVDVVGTIAGEGAEEIKEALAMVEGVGHTALVAVQVAESAKEVFLEVKNQRAEKKDQVLIIEQRQEYIQMVKKLIKKEDALHQNRKEQVRIQQIQKSQSYQKKLSECSISVKEQQEFEKLLLREKRLKREEQRLKKNIKQTYVKINHMENSGLQDITARDYLTSSHRIAVRKRKKELTDGQKSEEVKVVKSAGENEKNNKKNKLKLSENHQQRANSKNRIRVASKQQGQKSRLHVASNMTANTANGIDERKGATAGSGKASTKNKLHLEEKMKKKREYQRNQGKKETRTRMMHYAISKAMSREGEDSFSKAVRDVVKTKVKRQIRNFVGKLVKKVATKILLMLPASLPVLLPIIAIVIFLLLLYQSPAALFLPSIETSASEDENGSIYSAKILKSISADYYIAIKDYLREKNNGKAMDATYTYSKEKKTGNYKDMLLVYACLSETGTDPCEINETNVLNMTTVMKKMTTYSCIIKKEELADGTPLGSYQIGIYEGTDLPEDSTDETYKTNNEDVYWCRVKSSTEIPAGSFIEVRGTSDMNAAILIVEKIDDTLGYDIELLIEEEQKATALGRFGGGNQNISYVKSDSATKIYKNHAYVDIIQLSAEEYKAKYPFNKEQEEWYELLTGEFNINELYE